MADPTRLDMATDADLLRAAHGSSAAFRVLYDRHAERINAFLIRRTRNPGAALELTAETFAQAWLSRDRYTDHDEGTIAPWLFGSSDPQATNAPTVLRRGGTIQSADIGPDPLGVRLVVRSQKGSDGIGAPPGL